MPVNEAVRPIVDTRNVLQRNRVAFGNRLDAIMREQDSAGEETVELYQRWHERFLTLEEEADKDIANMVRDMPIVQRMMGLRGIGPMLSAKLVSMIDIERADTVSALWRYCGLAVIDGQRERPVRGERLHYNARLKTVCYWAGESFLKAHSPYAQVYESAYKYYVDNRPEWGECLTCNSTLAGCQNRKLHSQPEYRAATRKTWDERWGKYEPGKRGWRTEHIHLASLRKAIKLFMSHLWVVWREMEGLPVTYPYAHERLGHQHYYSPEDFGW